MTTIAERPGPSRAKPLLVTGLGLMAGRFLSWFEDQGGWRCLVPLGLCGVIGFVVVQGELRNEVNWQIDNARSVLFAKVLAEANAKVAGIDAVILPHVFDESLFLTRVPRGTVVFGGMLASTLLAIPFVPVYFIIMQRVSERLGSGARLAKKRVSKGSLSEP